MNEDIKQSKEIFKLLLNVKKLNQDLPETQFTSLNMKLNHLIDSFRGYKVSFSSNEELRDKCERLYNELVKASSFLVNLYMEQLGKMVLNRKTITDIIDSLDINNNNIENGLELDEILKNIRFIVSNLEGNFYHSDKKLLFSNKIQFIDQSLCLFQKNFNELQGISQQKAPGTFNHKEFFNKTITTFSNILKLDPSSENNIRLKPLDDHEFTKEDLLDCLERYIQRNKSLFDLESQAFEYEKEKLEFIKQEEVFGVLLKRLISKGQEGLEGEAEKYEEIEGFFSIFYILYRFFSSEYKEMQGF